MKSALIYYNNKIAKCVGISQVRIKSRNIYKILKLSGELVVIIYKVIS